MARPPRGSRVDSRGRTSRERLGRLKRRKFMRKFGENLLDRAGFDQSEFSSKGFVKGKLGLFGGAIKRGRKASDSGAVPSMKSPSSVSNKANPSLSTIVDQLESLVKTAKNIGVISKEQQKSLLNSIIETRKNDKESFIEDNGSTLQGGGAGISAETLAPLSTAIEQLSKKLGLLNKTLDEKQDESEEEGGEKRTFASKFFDNLGFGDEYEGYKRRKNRPLSADEQRDRRVAERDRRAARVRPEDLLDRNGRRLSGGAMDSRLDALDRRRRQGSIFSRFKSSIGGSVRAAGVGISSLRGGGIKGALRKIAGPLIGRTLGRTALKSIPIVGALAGGAFAISRLLQGDTVGAGIEASSGLAGPLTAVPAMVTTIARDSYSGVYGVQPEQDPQAPERIKELKTGVEDLVKEAMVGQIDAKRKPTQDEIDDALIGDIKQPKVTAESKPPPVSIPDPPAPPKPKSNGSSKGGSAGGGGAGAAGAGAAGAGGASGAAGSAASGSFNISPELMSEIDARSQSELMSNKGTGAELTQQTLDVVKMDESDEAIIQTLSAKGPPMPSTMPTTKPGASGMGDVRSPYYPGSEMGSIPNQVYY